MRKQRWMAYQSARESQAFYFRFERQGLRCVGIQISSILITWTLFVECPTCDVLKSIVSDKIWYFSQVKSLARNSSFGKIGRALRTAWIEDWIESKLYFDVLDAPSYTAASMKYENKNSVIFMRASPASWMEGWKGYPKYALWVSTSLWNSSCTFL